MVNTFIPYADFKKCAKVLDNQRLGKQRVEAKQILNILTDATQTRGWRNHPVVKMWEGHAKALMLYYNEIVLEWISRGFQNNMPLYVIRGKVKMPWFIGNHSVHLSHQANLIRKNIKYAQRFKTVPPEYIKYTYIWPSKLLPSQIDYLKTNKNRIVEIRFVSTRTTQPSQVFEV
jgi:hypothetical protein